MTRLQPRLTSIALIATLGLSLAIGACGHRGDSTGANQSPSTTTGQTGGNNGTTNTNSDLPSATNDLTTSLNDLNADLTNMSVDLSAQDQEVQP